MKGKKITKNSFLLTLMVLVIIFSCRLFLPDKVLAGNSPKVLIDLSHEFTFKYNDDLPLGYLTPEGYEATRSLATITPELLSCADVLVIEQVTTSVPFTSAQISAVKDFVLRGGGLLIIGKKSPWGPSEYYPEVKDYPLNSLSEVFGVSFIEGYGTAPFQVTSGGLLPGVTVFDTQGSMPGLLKTMDNSCRVVVSDSAGEPLFVMKTFGAGHVAVCGEDNFIYAPFGKNPINKEFVKQLFIWLSCNKTTRNASYTAPERILPEKKILQGTITLYYPESLGTAASYLTAYYPVIYNHLVAIMGVEPVYNFTIIALATGGGGYSGGQELGIGVLAKYSYVIGVFAHELTHSFVCPGGLPGAFGEGWATLAAERVLTLMGYEQDARNERQLYNTEFAKMDPDYKTLNLNNNNISQGEIMAYMGKAMWTIESLEKYYGSDFMFRLMRLHRQQVQSGAVSQPVTMDQFINMAGTAAGADLKPFFREIGTR